MRVNDYDVVADLYDTYVPYDFDVKFFIDETKKAGGEVLELMSGTGRVSIPLLEAGVKLTCVDLSGGENAILRDKLRLRGLRAEVYDMDVCKLSLGRQFAMVIIPFHSFAHIVSVEDQRAALDGIRQHLKPGGRFICTLRNPAVRRADVDGQLHLVNQYRLPAGDGMLLWWTVESYADEDRRIVEAHQFYEEYDGSGHLRRKRLLTLHFCLPTRQEFESLACAAGFQVQALYGDYSCGEFDEQTSEFMIWTLEA